MVPKIDSTCRFARLICMEIHLTPEKEALLRELAARTGQDTAQVIQDAVDRLLDHDSWFREEVQKGQAEAARGNLISHEEVGKRIEKLLQEKQSGS